MWYTSHHEIWVWSQYHQKQKNNETFEKSGKTVQMSMLPTYNATNNRSMTQHLNGPSWSTCMFTPEHKFSLSAYVWAQIYYFWPPQIRNRSVCWLSLELLWLAFAHRLLEIALLSVLTIKTLWGKESPRIVRGSGDTSLSTLTHMGEHPPVSPLLVPLSPALWNEWCIQRST